MLVRWSWPRFRFDQLMALAWKVMLPLGLVNLVAVADAEQPVGQPGQGSSWLAWTLVFAGLVLGRCGWRPW